MKLPHSFQTHIPITGNASAAKEAVKQQAESLDFEEFSRKLDQKTKDYSKVDLDEIETRWVKSEVVDENGHVREVMREVAICPECGEENCPCIARITVQQRIDEENAKGIRNAKKPDPIVPQTFNQMNMEFNSNRQRRPRF
jgi:acetyl-CoA carboxylase beta subunit